ncbi:hypothetical protein T439DRAFT_326658 [Meredithblackwellia eburnea MCA 4105]
MSKKFNTTPEEWKARLAEINVTKEDLNQLVANYLYVEGFRDAAENFSREAGISPIDLASIESRMEIKRAVQRGDVEEATEMVNELDPEILDTNPVLHFHLLQLQLIELIRQNRISEALVFAQTELAPRGEENPEFLHELERTMALLAFEMPNLLSPTAAPAPAPMAVASTGKGKKEDTTPPPMPESIASLLDQSQRSKTAKELNAAILTSQSHGKEPKLPGLLKMLAWGETMLSDKGADYPKWQFHDLLKEKEKPATEPDAMVL